MSPWPPEGEPTGKGKEAVTLPRPGHADLAGVMKYGLSDVRDALERASARHTAAIVAAGGVAKALLREIGIEVAGSVVTEHLEQRIDDARADRDTVGGIVEVRGARGPAGPRLLRDEGGPPRRAPRLDAHGHAGGQGRRDRGRVRARRRSAAPRPTTRSSATRAATGGRRTARAGSRPASRTARRSSCARR